MKIEVKFDASQSMRRDTYSLDDLGFSEEDWLALTDEEKRIELMCMVENDQPYWAVGTFTEIKMNY